MDVLLTGDGMLSREQNLAGRRLAIMALLAIQPPIIKKHLPKIIAAINDAAPGSIQMVDCGTFRRKKQSGGLPRRVSPARPAAPAAMPAAVLVAGWVGKVSAIALK